jgi:hypothetical protein
MAINNCACSSKSVKQSFQPAKVFPERVESELKSRPPEQNPAIVPEIQQAGKLAQAEKWLKWQFYHFAKLTFWRIVSFPQCSCLGF